MAEKEELYIINNFSPEEQTRIAEYLVEYLEYCRRPTTFASALVKFLNKDHFNGFFFLVDENDSYRFILYSDEGRTASDLADFIDDGTITITDFLHYTLTHLKPSNLKEATSWKDIHMLIEGFNNEKHVS